MRWRLVLVSMAAAVLASIASISIAAGPIVVSDNFDSGGYAGSTGTAGGGWTGPWTEIGESDGPAAGAVRVKTFNGCSSKCLVVSGSLLYLGSGVTRTAEVPGNNTVTLTYSTDFGLLTTAVLSVQVNPDAKGWKTVAVRTGTGTFTDSVGVVATTVGVRFTVTGLGLTGSTAVDDVALSFLTVPTPTTTIGLPIPPITLPTIPTITLVPSTSTTTFVPAPTTTTLSTLPSTTTSTRPVATTSTTTTRVDDDALVVTVGGPPSVDGQGGVNPTDGGDVRVEPTRADGVIMHLDPGLMPTAMLSDEDVQVVAGLAVPFGMRTEHLSLDLTLYVILGLTLAVVSALRFELANRE